jgi:hypothetical protein
MKIVLLLVSATLSFFLTLFHVIRTICLSLLSALTGMPMMKSCFWRYFVYIYRLGVAVTNRVILYSILVSVLRRNILFISDVSSNNLLVLGN